jgi:hypothetical protein
VLLVSAIVDIWSSYVGDPMEVNRHLVGPLVRLNVTAVVAIALGADRLLAPAGPADDPTTVEADA